MEKQARYLATAWLAALVGSGCSLGWVDNPSGGNSNLPTLGAGPFHKPPLNLDTPADEPFVIFDPRARVFEPTALDRDDGGFRIWYAKQEDDSDIVDIWRSELASVYEVTDGGDQSVFRAEMPWEEGRVSAPSIIEEEDGRLLMVYEGGNLSRGIGAAISDDGGQSWTRAIDSPIIEDAVTPTVAWTGDSYLIVFARPGDRSAFYAADGGSITAVEVRDSPILRSRPGRDDAFDNASISSPNLLIQRTQGNRDLYGIHFAGRDKRDAATIGFAASFDGETWERFDGDKPVVSNTPPNELAPAWLPRDTTAFLFFGQERQLRDAIAVGIHP